MQRFEHISCNGSNMFLAAVRTCFMQQFEHVSYSGFSFIYSRLDLSYAMVFCFYATNPINSI